MSEALRLADALERRGYTSLTMNVRLVDREIAAELRRLHALNAELVKALREMWELWHDDPAYGHEAADRARELLAKVEAGNEP